MSKTNLILKQWENAKYLSISTQKRDGTWVNTPVWFANDETTFYIFSEGSAGKVKRIKNFTDVKITPCTMLGKVTGQWQEAKAEILQNQTAIKTAYSSLLKKYGWELRLLDVGSTLARKIDKRAFIKISLVKDSIQ